MDILNCEYKFDTKKLKNGYPFISCRVFPENRCEEIPDSSCPRKQYALGVITENEYKRKIRTWTHSIMKWYKTKI